MLEVVFFINLRLTLKLPIELAFKVYVLSSTAKYSIVSCAKSEVTIS